jgi:DDE superfamily endonuclease
MVVPLIAIPSSIEIGLAPYRDLFPRIETYQHIKEYCTGLVVLEKPSINRLAQCLVDGPGQSSLNKAITRSPWSGEAVNARRLEQIRKHHRGKGLTIGIIDSTFSHHPRGEKKIYGVYRYWDYVNGCYTSAIQLVTAAIATGDRCDGFDYRIYHRFHQQQELAYLEATRLSPDEPDRQRWLRRLVELLAYDLHRRQHKTKPQLAVELIGQMEASEMAPDVYTVDSALFAPVVIESIEKQGKPWLADSEKTRLVFWQGQAFNCETFAQSRPDEAYRPVMLTRHGQEKMFWVFTCVVRIKKYGKVRLAVIYDQPGRPGKPIYCFTPMLTWNAQKIVQVRCHRWDIEPLHEQIKQFLGAEDSQLQTEAGVRRHLTLVFVVNSLLKSLDLSQPLGDLPMTEFQGVSPTFGQRCRRIFLEVFYELIQTIHRWLEERQMTPTQIFETLFKRLLYV